MAEDRRFLIGRGETLTETVRPPGRIIQDKFHPYTFAEAKQHIMPRVRRAVAKLDDLPDAACPNDQAVAIVTIHPSYLAKSYYPDALLKAVQLHAIGSRATTINVRKGTSRQFGKKLATAELYVAGKRTSFSKWNDRLGGWSADHSGAQELRHVEDFYAEEPADRIRDAEALRDHDYFETVLQITEDQRDILSAFRKWTQSFEGKALIEKRQHIGGLCYIPVAINADALVGLAKFSFLRGLRRMPELRSFLPFRASGKTFTPRLPTGAAVNPHIRVAILDGGLPPHPDLSRWAQSHDADTVGAPHPKGPAHGLAVTSALLFGSLEDGQSLPAPFAPVEHHRIADVNMTPPDLYDILPRVEAVLTTNHFDYINLSVGPAVTVDDSLVHAWTAKLDDLLSHGKTLAFIAVGNHGTRKGRARQRIGPPADSVNGLGIGACDSTDLGWGKATYSAIGPGRGCGIVKPDIVAFGGEQFNDEFGVLESGLPITAAGTVGTSFASPNALRTALGAAAHFGHALHPLAVKALLIHHAVRSRSQLVGDVGWGRIPTDYEDLVTCAPDTAHVVYQGILKPGKYLRAPIPVPTKFGNGPVYITATICFAAKTEPQNTVSYTRAGLEVYFRPHADRRSDPKQRYADTASFFRASDLKQPEGALRTDALKWETTLKKMRRFTDSTTLKDPVFDIHYVAREHGGPATDPANIPYAMVVTVRQKGFVLLYDRIVNRYRGVLEPLVPAVRIPVRVMPGES